MNRQESNGFLGGRLNLRRPLGGHRAGLDAILLAACAPAQARGLAYDAGAGVGAAGLSALLHAPKLSMRLIEIDQNLTACARENIEANGMGDRAQAVCADLLTPASRRAADLRDESADLILTNPPFYAAHAHRISPDPAKARAHVGALEPWMRASLALLKPGGIFVMIHRPESLGAILESAKNRLGSMRLKPVLAHADRSAIRILIAGRKGARGPLSILPELVLHQPDGAYVPIARDICAGDAFIDMGLAI